MSNVFYLIAILLVAAWAIGFFVFSMGTFIHLLLVLGLTSLFLRIYMGAKPVL